MSNARLCQQQLVASRPRMFDRRPHVFNSLARVAFSRFVLCIDFSRQGSQRRPGVAAEKFERMVFGNNRVQRGVAARYGLHGM